VTLFLKKITIKKIVIAAFSIIIGTVLLLGGSAFFGIQRLNYVNELNNDSYKVFMQMHDIQDAIKDAEGDIREYFSGNGWKSHADAASGAAAFFSMNDEQLKADIYATGNLFWAVHIFQGSFPLNENEKYKLSFNAKSTVNREMQVFLENTVVFYKHFTDTIQMTQEMKTYTIDFEMVNKRDELTRLLFALGKISDDTANIFHRVFIDNVSLIEVSTGKELIHNGGFSPKDISNTVPVAKKKFSEAIRTTQELISDSLEQRSSLHQLEILQNVWLENKKKVIEGLSLTLRSSGALDADSELQSLEANVTSKAEIENVIAKIKQLEDVRLEERKEEAKTIKIMVYSMLGIALLLSILLAVGIYIYFNKAIIKPLVWTSDILKDMAEGDGTKKKSVKVIDENMDSAIYEVRQLNHHIMHYLKLLNVQIQIDGLTGLNNRKTFDAVIEEWIDQKNPFFLILIDIDYFKKVNDTYGHLVGDEVIKYLASMMLSVSRDGDLCFRYGGEEFGMLIMGKNADDAFKIAERLREKVADTASPSGRPITISSGISAYQDEDQYPETIIERADAALYQSKSDGRNKTTVSLTNKTIA
jgi:diguanylate cyclase (GGDEF)-like protein